MTFAWYGHLKNLGSKPLIVAVLASWGIAFFEYLLQVPANRIGFGKLTLPQLKMLQEVITLSVFVPFSMFYMRQPIRLDFLWAACACAERCTSCSAARRRRVIKPSRQLTAIQQITRSHSSFSASTISATSSQVPRAGQADVHSWSW